MKRHGQTLTWRWWPIVGIAIVVAMVIAPVAHVLAVTSVAVDVKDFTFSPLSLTVSSGTTVTWTNHDQLRHTVTSTAGVFDSKALRNGETFAQAFAQPGTYQYFCALHPQMQATVIVK